jgi:hypothetical protein
MTGGSSVSKWYKSSRCSTGACVEVLAGNDEVLLRDSENPEGARLSVSISAWSYFIAGIKEGRFDAPSGSH